MTNRDFLKNFSEEDFVKWLAGFELVENAPCEFEVDECLYGVADLTVEELIEMWLSSERKKFEFFLSF